MDTRSHNPAPQPPPNIEGVSNDVIVGEVVRRQIYVDISRLPDDVLIRELFSRTETAFLVGTFMDHNGVRSSRFRAHGDYDIVTAKLRAASDAVSNTARRGWGEAEAWT